MDNKYFIDIHVLATSLFIILMENNSDIREVPFGQLSKFRKIVEEEANNNNLKFIFVLSRSDTIRFFCDNSDTFYHDEDDSLIKVREGITPYHLIYDRAYLPLDPLLVLNSENVKNKTLDIMNLKKTNEPKRDLYYYINDLKIKLDEYASNMEYEKCIELRRKYIELKNMEGLQKQVKEKAKKLTLENIDEPRSIWDWPL